MNSDKQNEISALSRVLFKSGVRERLATQRRLETHGILRNGSPRYYVIFNIFLVLPD
jgi:hypothetical protein